MGDLFGPIWQISHSIYLELSLLYDVHLCNVHLCFLEPSSRDALLRAYVHIFLRNAVRLRHSENAPDDVDSLGKRWTLSAGECDYLLWSNI